MSPANHPGITWRKSRPDMGIDALDVYRFVTDSGFHCW
jgi:hypothetical protein